MKTCAFQRKKSKWKEENQLILRTLNTINHSFKVFPLRNIGPNNIAGKLIAPEYANNSYFLQTISENRKGEKAIQLSTRY